MPARAMSPNRWVSSVLNTLVDLHEMLVKHERLVDRMKRVSGSHETLVGARGTWYWITGVTLNVNGSLDGVLDHWTEYWIAEGSTGSLYVVSEILVDSKHGRNAVEEET